jgi:ERCC4-type nuclease
MSAGAAVVLLDSREPPLVKTAVLAALEPLAVAPLVAALETGDFVVRDGCASPCTVAVERKTVSDLLGSFRSGRLAAQLERLRASYRWPILLIEGEVRMSRDGKVVSGRSRQTQWSHASVQMYLWSVQRRLGISVMHAQNALATADIVRVLARRAVDGCVARQ